MTTKKAPAKKAAAPKKASTAKRTATSQGAKKAPPKRRTTRAAQTLPAEVDTPAKPPASRGRPTDFNEEYVEQARKLCRLGATDQEIADFFDVSARTIYRWKAEHDDFCQALKAGKAEADDRVERSLFARANGYEHDEVDIRVVNNAIVQTPIRKFYPPDTTACIFWLKNRRPEEWRDKVDHSLANPDGSPLTVVVKRYSDT